MVIFPNGIYAMESNHKMACCEKGKEHHDCCKKKDSNKHHSSEKKDTSKDCNQKNSACLCIGFMSTMSMKNQDVEDTEYLNISLSQKHILMNDKKPSSVYLSMWLLPKIKG